MRTASLLMTARARLAGRDCSCVARRTQSCHVICVPGTPVTMGEGGNGTAAGFLGATGAACNAHPPPTNNATKALRQFIIYQGSKAIAHVFTTGLAG